MAYEGRCAQNKQNMREQFLSLASAAAAAAAAMYR